MFINQVSLLFVLVFATIGAFAQGLPSKNKSDSEDIFSIIQSDSSGGVINLYQDASLHVLLEKSNRISEKKGVSGYRIQIYSGSGITAREKANSVKKEFMEYFPEVPEEIIYFDYMAPYFKVSIGDYRNKNEAYEIYHSVKKKFSGSYIIKSKINFPKLEVSADI